MCCTLPHVPGEPEAISARKVEYTTLLVAMEVAEETVNLLRENVLKTCPDHRGTKYTTHYALTHE